VVRKRLRHTDDDGGDDDSSNSPEEELPQEEPEEEVSSEVLSMKLDTSEEKLYARCTRGYLFGDDGDTPSTSLDTPPTLESHQRSDEESSQRSDEESSDDDDNNDFWM
jgi:hypothetical protein